MKGRVKGPSLFILKKRESERGMTCFGRYGLLVMCFEQSSPPVSSQEFLFQEGKMAVMQDGLFF